MFLPAGTHTSQRGTIILMAALILTAILSVTALALDTYFISIAKLQQSATSEYIALATLRTFFEPPLNGGYNGNQSDEVSRYNFAIERGALLGATRLLGASGIQLSPSDLRISAGSNKDNSNDCQPGSSHRNSWCGFLPASDRGSVIFGSFNPNSSSGFVPAPPGSANSANAVKINLQLAPSSSPIILPLGKLLLGEGQVRFNSTACAYFDSPGSYHLIPAELCNAGGAAPGPTPIATPTSTLPTPSPTPIYTPTPTALPTETIIPSATPTPDGSVTPTSTPLPTSRFKVGLYNFGDNPGFVLTGAFITGDYHSMAGIYSGYYPPASCAAQIVYNALTNCGGDPDFPNVSSQTSAECLRDQVAGTIGLPTGTATSQAVELVIDVNCQPTGDSPVGGEIPVIEVHALLAAPTPAGTATGTPLPTPTPSPTPTSTVTPTSTPSGPFYTVYFQEWGPGDNTHGAPENGFGPPPEAPEGYYSAGPPCLAGIIQSAISSCGSYSLDVHYYALTTQAQAECYTNSLASSFGISPIKIPGVCDSFCQYVIDQNCQLVAPVSDFSGGESRPTVAATWKRVP